ncbi:MAG: 50S ribosomal protein L29 [Candidatus Omnitrophota bacterium]
MTKVKDLRNLTDEELKGKENSLFQELFKLNQQRYSGRVEKPHLFKRVRKDIARIKTILNQRAGKNK